MHEYKCNKSRFRNKQKINKKEINFPKARKTDLLTTDYFNDC